MQIIYGVKKIHQKHCSAITIGIFDGVHLGHKAVIKELIKEAKNSGCRSVLITFYPHPESVIKKNRVPMLISLWHRIEILKSLDIDDIVVAKFTKKFSELSAEEFIGNYLKKKFNLKKLVVSKNFSFGNKKRGNIKYLKKLSKKYGFTLKTLKTKKVNGIPISSTAIRNLVLQGDLRGAEKLLGRRFSIIGHVVKGDGIGKKIGFPTANIEVHNEAIPPDGVYAAYVKLDGKIFKGALSIGRKPTFRKSRAKNPYIEVYILNFSGDIYKKDIEVVPIKMIRPDKKFKDLYALRKRIEKDVKAIKVILSKEASRA